MKRFIIATSVVLAVVALLLVANKTQSNQWAESENSEITGVEFKIRNAFKEPMYHWGLSFSATNKGTETILLPDAALGVYDLSIRSNDGRLLCHIPSFSPNNQSTNPISPGQYSIIAGDSQVIGGLSIPPLDRALAEIDTGEVFVQVKARFNDFEHPFVSTPYRIDMKRH